MGPRKKSLAEELADLYNPAPKEHNPDDDIGGDAVIDELDIDDVERRPPTKRVPEKALRLRGDIAIEDAAYRGRRSSRAAVFGEEADLGLGQQQGSEEGDEGEGSEDEGSLDGFLSDEEGEGEEEEEEEEEEEDGMRKAPAGRAGHSGRGAREEDDDEEEEEEDDMLPSVSGSEDEEEEEARAKRAPSSKGQKAKAAAAAAAGSSKQRPGSKGKAAAGDDDELTRLEAEYAALREEEEAAMAALRDKGAKDATRGSAVRSQQLLYERSLEWRILLQRPLQASNGLPRPAARAALVAALPEAVAEYRGLAEAAGATLAALLDLQAALMRRIPAIAPLPSPAANGPAPASAAPSRKRQEPDQDEDAADANGDTSAAPSASVESLWDRISAHTAALAPYRDASLDSWHRRTAGGAAGGGGLRALNQSVSAQVGALMRDPDRAVKRTRLTLAARPRVLGEPAQQQQQRRQVGAEADEEADGLDGAAAAVAGEAGDGEEEARDPETYDDAEFYAQLLKEFLDKGLAGAAAAAPRAAKQRKAVDRRASKGRKLRYHVQEKLVAFMAPVDSEPPPYAANLFSNLFGHAGAAR